MKRLILILFSLTLVACKMHGQSSSLTTDVFYNGSISYPIINSPIKDQFGYDERVSFASSYGLILNLQISQRFMIGSGISIEGYSNDIEFDFYGYETDTALTLPDQYYHYGYRENASYLNIPLLITTKINDRNSFRIGISNNFFLRSVTTKHDFEQPEAEDESTVTTVGYFSNYYDFSPYYPGFKVSYGYIVSLKNNFSLGFEPEFNILLKCYDGALGQYHHMRFGLSLVLRYN